LWEGSTNLSKQRKVFPPCSKEDEYFVAKQKTEKKAGKKEKKKKREKGKKKTLNITINCV